MGHSHHARARVFKQAAPTLGARQQASRQDPPIHTCEGLQTSSTHLGRPPASFQAGSSFSH
eukprot:scaffold111978_cov21-Tisochrysis_lutea.AAC.4